MTTGESAEQHSTARLLFRVDGMVEKLRLINLKTQETVAAAMDAVMKAVGMRGPDPDFPPQDDDIRRLAAIVERLQLHRPNHYHNGNGVSKAVITVLCTLVAAGIIGGVAMFGKLSAIEANQISQQRQLDTLSNLVRRSP